MDGARPERRTRIGDRRERIHRRDRRDDLLWSRDRDRRGSELYSGQLHRLHRSSGRWRLENQQCSRVEPELESLEQWHSFERHRLARVRPERRERQYALRGNR